MTDTIDICPVDAIPENESRGFSLHVNENDQAIFIIRKAGHFFGYTNRCPHTGINLDWQPDQFLNIDGTLIQCSTHGARFRITDGYCIYGPCLGRSLTPVKLVREADRLKMIIE